MGKSSELFWGSADFTDQLWIDSLCYKNLIFLRYYLLRQYEASKREDK